VYTSGRIPAACICAQEMRKRTTGTEEYVPVCCCCGCGSSLFFFFFLCDAHSGPPATKQHRVCPLRLRSPLGGLQTGAWAHLAQHALALLGAAVLGERGDEDVVRGARGATPSARACAGTRACRPRTAPRPSTPCRSRLNMPTSKGTAPSLNHGAAPSPHGAPGTPLQRRAPPRGDPPATPSPFTPAAPCASLLPSSPSSSPSSPPWAPPGAPEAQVELGGRPRAPPQSFARRAASSRRSSPPATSRPPTPGCCSPRGAPPPGPCPRHTPSLSPRYTLGVPCRSLGPRHFQGPHSRLPGQGCVRPGGGAGCTGGSGVPPRGLRLCAHGLPPLRHARARSMSSMRPAWGGKRQNSGARGGGSSKLDRTSQIGV